MERLTDILVIDDNPGDARLVMEALHEQGFHGNVSVMRDGVEAMAFLRRQEPYASAPRPCLILLDLNMPRKDGREVLAEIKQDTDLRRIPVVVLTTSRSVQDISQSYDLHANCYISKPLGFDQFLKVIETIQNYWFQTASLPSE